MKLNKAQQEAVETIHGPLLILAGAGVGKTSVLMNRIQHMIEQGIMPHNILAVTFTNKAAEEMRERLKGKVGEKDAQNVTMKTFHSFCIDVLRREVGYVDSLDKGFEIADDAWSKRIVKGILKGMNTRVQPGTILGYISLLKGELVTPTMVENGTLTGERVDREKAGAILDACERAGHMDVLRVVFPLYQAKLEDANALDFDDFIAKVIQLWEEHPAILAKYQERYRYIMIDEYQDTNKAQYELAKLLSEKFQHIAVVGDDSQSIYGFRGADIRNILEFDRDFPNAVVVKLEENYRSTKHILSAANDVINRNKTKKEKHLYTRKGDGEKVLMVELEYQEDQAQFVADTIHELVASEGRDYEDFAVLYRTNRQSLTMETTFKSEKIPHTVYSGLGFFDREEIQDIIKYLQLLANPRNIEAFERVIQKPKRRIGEKTIEKIFNSLEDKTILDILKAPEGIIRMQKVGKKEGQELADILEHYQAKMDTESVSDIIKGILEDVGYVERYLVQYSEAVRTEKLGNIEELYLWIHREEEKRGGILTVRDFIEEVVLGAASSGDGEGSGVKLMSIHASKGLEFPVVFLIGMNNQTFPTYQAIDQYQLGNNTLLEEERRLCYVAITRAKEKLYTTYFRKRVNQKREESEIYPSVFLQEIRDDHKKQLF